MLLLLPLLLLLHHVYAYPSLSGSFNVGENVYCLDMSEDGSLLAIGTINGRFYLLNNKLRIMREESYDKSIIKVAISKEYYALATIDGKLECYQENSLLYDIKLGKTLNCLDISENGDILACYGDNLTLFINGKNYWSKVISPRDAALAQNSKYIAVANRDGNLSLYSKDGKLLWKKSIKGARKVSISYDGEYITLCNDNYLYLFDKDGNLIYERKVEEIKDVEISKDGNYVLCALQNSLIFFDRFGHRLWEYKVKENKTIEDTALSEYGNIISIAYWSGEIELYNNSKIEKKIVDQNKNITKVIKREKEKKNEGNKGIPLTSIIMGIIVLMAIAILLSLRKK